MNTSNANADASQGFVTRVIQEANASVDNSSTSGATSSNQVNKVVVGTNKEPNTASVKQSILELAKQLNMTQSKSFFVPSGNPIVYTLKGPIVDTGEIPVLHNQRRKPEKNVIVNEWQPVKVHSEEETVSTNQGSKQEMNETDWAKQYIESVDRHLSETRNEANENRREIKEYLHSCVQDINSKFDTALNEIRNTQKDLKADFREIRTDNKSTKRWIVTLSATVIVSVVALVGSVIFFLVNLFNLFNG